MTTYVITVPGTFTAGVDDAARQRLGRALRPADPHGTKLGSAEDLDVLAVNDDNTFALRLTVEADTSADAEREARRLADTALRDAGLDAEGVPLGPAVITGIDSEIA
ncbi:hypothetical protein AB0N99_07760 [Streptomyces sp. NPDC093272]|jgi:hypothetical protein|uniref:hypothetical protein n=1 Tax=unclassified Streptomyces TaxID=2593676 RepID=UPI00332F18D8